jgi:hypothetical protein
MEIMRNPKVKAAIKALSDEVGATVDFEDVYKWKDTSTCIKFLGKPTLKVFDDPQHGPILSNGDST